mmetsp:Transcript_3689/g.13260  ORF Transcript_3689/g.13260 Transcript_3689/m.13260 type:complete len:589 (+) Transcript_3689:118-1884(+)
MVKAIVALLVGLALCACAPLLGEAEVFDIEQEGAKASQLHTVALSEHNAAVINDVLQRMRPLDTLLVPNKTFWTMGGISASGLTDVTIQLEGTLKFSSSIKSWPRDETGAVKGCILLSDARNLTLTSSGTGTLDGNGERWWGWLKYLEVQEDRPRLLELRNSSQLLVEHWLLKDSPYWSFWANDVDTLEVRHAAVDVRRNAARQHDLYNLQAFNTDGFDVAGRHVWIHDCSVWNDDDSVCVKELGREGQQAQCSEHILVERVAASGLGLSVGSVGASADHHCVRNVTFRDCTMRDTYKVGSGMARRGQRRRCGGGAGGALQQTCGEVSVAAAQGIYVKSRPDAQAAEGSYRPPSARDQELLELLQRSYREDEELEGTLLAAHGGVRGGDDDSESLEAFLERVQSVFDGMGLELTPLDEGALLALDAEAQEQQQEMGAGGASETATGMSAEISDVMYENIVIHKPTQWSIWVGPQQAVYAGACSLLWPWVPGTSCPVPRLVSIRGISLRNVTVVDPSYSAGVLLGNELNPIRNIRFDSVTVYNEGSIPWGEDSYKCEHVLGGFAVGRTSPVPPCFRNGTVPQASGVADS